MNDHSDKLSSAIYAIQLNQPEYARSIINELLDKEPNSTDVLIWACEIAETSDEKIRCLEKILAIDPSDSCAKSYLKELGGEIPQLIDSKNGQGRDRKKQSQTSLINQFVLVFQVTIFIIALALAGYGGYSLINRAFPGQTNLFSQEITISETFDRMNSDDLEWHIAFESKNETTFTGLVRHTSEINISQLPLLSHDILVTSGDFADPELVSTNVSNHHFRWFANNNEQPNGTINLLHTVPANEDILKQLESIKREDEVIIKGKEILAIKVYDKDGTYLAEWRDSGCNTMLVNSVSYK